MSYLPPTGASRLPGAREKFSAPSGYNARRVHPAVTARRQAKGDQAPTSTSGEASAAAVKRAGMV